MKPNIRLLFASIIASVVFLSSCGTPASGPQAWLDWPLDNSTAPLAPLSIQTHASDENGIAQIEFFVNDTLLITVDSDGSRLSEAIYEWTPPAPGTYAIKVRAIDTGGNPGGYALSTITIGDQASIITTITPQSADPLCDLAQLVAPVLQTPADNDTVSTPVHLVWSNLPYPEIGCHPHSWRIDISELPDFSDTSLGFVTLDHLETSRDWPLPADKCYYWRVLAYVPDDFGPPSLARKFCIPAPPTTVTVSPSPTLTRVVTITPTLTRTPTITKTPTLTSPPPVIDASPPSFYITDVGPDVILTNSGGCPSYERTVAVAALVSDESGLSSVIAYWHIGGAESGQVSLSLGDLGYWAKIGPVNTTGTMEVYITARDTIGNVAQSGMMYVTVNSCID